MLFRQFSPQLLNLKTRLFFLTVQREIGAAINETVMRRQIDVSSRKLIRDVDVLQRRRRLRLEPRTVRLETVGHAVVLVLGAREGGSETLFRWVGRGHRVGGGHQDLRLLHLLAQVQLTLVHHQSGLRQAARSSLL